MTVRQLWRMWNARRRELWDHTSLLASILAEKPASRFFPFDAEGRPKISARGAKADEPDIPYDQNILKAIVAGGKLAM